MSVLKTLETPISTYPSDQMWVAIDSLVFGFDHQEADLKILLFQRKLEPLAGGWSLIGDLVKKNEDIDKAAKRVLKNFTGLEGVFLEQLATFGRVDRDPGGRVISILYWSLIQLNEYNKRTPHNLGARWFPIRNLPELILDHQQMVELALEKLAMQARTSPIGFELLGEKFTLPQLKKLYDAIYLTTIDERNFRKKILSTHILKKLDIKDKSTSRKGAFLYQFDREKYEELRKKGILLDFNIKHE